MSERLVERLKQKFGADILESHADFGDDTVLVRAGAWKEICSFLRSDPASDMNMMVDLCGVDYPERLPRLEVVLHLYSIAKRHRIRVKTRVGDAEMDGAELDSVTSIWPGANWFERETFDMCGVKFQGHPNLRRILMYPEFEGHPLLKSYPAQKTQPLVPYRTEAEAGVPLDKLAPFRDDEGLSFGRRDERQWTEPEWTQGERPQSDAAAKEGN